MVVPPSRCTGLAVLISGNIGGSPAFWNQGGNSLTPWACAHSGRSTSANLWITFGVIYLSHFLKDKTWPQLDTCIVHSLKAQKSVFLYSIPDLSPQLPRCNLISISVFCQHLNWIHESHCNLFIKWLLSYPLAVISRKCVLIFFFSNMDTLRVLQVSKSWFIFAHQSFTFSMAFYPKSGRNQVMPSMLWLEMSSSNFQHHLQIVPSTKCWDTTQAKFFAFL